MVVFLNYKFKYASNPIIDELRDKPYEHRVAIAPIAWPSQLAVFYKLYKGEWIQQQLPYYNVQTFETVEMPRIPEDFSAFTKAINAPFIPALFHFSRALQLTDTSYLLGPADFGNLWNRQLANTPLQTLTRFNLQLRPGIIKATHLDEITAVPDSYGAYALFDFASALPRAKLYSRWQINPNDTNVLAQLFNPGFNPQNSVFVAGNAPPDPQTNAVNPPDDAVQFVSYAPKDIVLSAHAAVAGILVLCDHFHPDWKVFVDKRPAALLRCNFLMRGVYLPAGTHSVEFKYQPAVRLLYVSALAVVIALILFGRFVYVEIKSRPKVSATAPVLAALPRSPKKLDKPFPQKKAQKK
ncbi:MAG: hypothetical protein ACREFR_08710 [Limisphaerales bacterium]